MRYAVCGSGARSAVFVDVVGVDCGKDGVDLGKVGSKMT